MSQSLRFRALVLIGSVLAQLVVMPAAQARPRCNGQRATMVGTDKADRIKGTKGDDVIFSGRGADFVRGSGGDDVICSGRGSDFVVGGGGNDTVEGQAGVDQLIGGAGNDSLTVNEGFFQIVVGGGGDDRLIGNQNLIFTSYLKAPSGVTIDLAAGTASGGHGNDILLDIAGVEGSNFDDTLTGDTDLNFLFGGDGNDAISSGGNGGTIESLAETGGDPALGAEYDFIGGGPGDDTLMGNEGLDVVTFDVAEAPVDANLTTGVATGEGDDTIADVEILLGSRFEDTLTGDDEDNAFEGYGGADTIDGKAGDDVGVYFDSFGVNANLTDGTATAEYQAFTEIGPVADTSTDSLKAIEDLWGSFNDDSLTGDQFANEFIGFQGDDELNGEAGDDSLIGHDGTDEADGGDGDDACDAEAEVNCEREAPATRSLSPLFWRSFLDNLHRIH